MGTWKLSISANTQTARVRPRGHYGRENKGRGHLPPTRDPSPSNTRQASSLDPDDGVVEFGVDGLQVLQGRSLVEHPLVEREGEARVNELSVVQSLGRENAQRRSAFLQAGSRVLCIRAWAPSAALCPESTTQPATPGPKGGSEK